MAMTTGAPDETLPLRNLLYIGAYQALVNEASQAAGRAASAGVRAARRVLLARAHVATRRAGLAAADLEGVVTSGGDGGVDSLVAAQALAALSLTPQDAAVVSRIESLAAAAVASPTAPVGDTLALIATALVRCGRPLDALRLLARAPGDLECIALAVQVSLALNRPDLARAAIAAFKPWADDATLAQLIEAWTNLVTGGPDKYNEAYYTFEEIANTHTPTSHLLTNKAVALIHSRKFTEAETVLLDSLNRDPSNEDTLANLIVVATALHKPVSVVNQYLMQIRDVAPNHSLVQEIDFKESMFDRCAAMYAV